MKTSDEILTFIEVDANMAQQHIISTGQLKHWVKKINQLEAEVTKWKTEANRLYGVGQDIEELRVQLEADNTALRDCILAMENDQACLPEDVSVTECVTALQKKLYSG